MLAILWTTARSLWSKAGLYLLAGAGVALFVGTVAVRLIATGEQKQKLEQATGTLRAIRKDKQVEADIDSLSAAAARKRLRDKWARR